MNGAALKGLFDELLAGRSIGDTTFYQLVNSAKNRREARRPWMKLRTIDSSNSVSSSTTHTTPFSLPERFIRFHGKYPIRLVDGSDVLRLDERPLEQLDELQNRTGFFCVDYANEVFYITGVWSKGFTMKIHYCKKSPDIDAGTAWSFPEEFHAMLAFDAALQEKGDISYDDINARMATYHGKSIADIERSMVMWDAQLQVNSRGV